MLHANIKQPVECNNPEIVPIYNIKQPNWHDVMAKSRKLDGRSEKAREINESIGAFIAYKQRPINIVEDESFIRMVHTLNPQYELPGRTKFMDTILPGMSQKALNKLSQYIGQAEYISFTSDLWTAPLALDCFIAFTGHMMMPNFEQHCVLLQAKHFKARHTAENIQQSIQQVIDSYNIPENKIQFIVTDNAPNITNAIIESGFLHIPCFLHTLQLCINRSIFEQEGPKNMIARVKTIAATYRRSSVANQEFKDILKHLDRPEKVLTNDCPTRWNSTCSMCSRFLEEEPAIRIFCDRTDDIPKLSNKDWDFLKHLVPLLQTMERITNM